jgi:hypothetical protein
LPLRYSLTFIYKKQSDTEIIEIRLHLNRTGDKYNIGKMYI